MRNKIDYLLMEIVLMFDDFTFKQKAKGKAEGNEWNCQFVQT